MSPMAAKCNSKAVPNNQQNPSLPRASKHTSDVLQKRKRFEETQSAHEARRKLTKGYEQRKCKTVAGIVTDTVVYAGCVADKGKGKASDRATASGVEAPDHVEYIDMSSDSER
ncbi:hypothetical protein RYX36_012364 [Vicia faba]